MLFGVWEWSAIGNNKGKLVCISAPSIEARDEELRRRPTRTHCEFDAQDEQEYAVKLEQLRKRCTMDSYSSFDDLPGGSK